MPSSIRGDSNHKPNMTFLLFEQSDGSWSAGVRRFVVFQSPSQLQQHGRSTYQYVGEQDIDLIRTNDTDSGTIANSTFQGGSIEVFAGPWTITGNTVLGSTADTYSPGAFGLHSPHDVLARGQPGFAVRSRRPRVPPGRPRCLGFR